MWPRNRNSPDLNPLDYADFGALQRRVSHRRKFNTDEERKRAIITEWQRFISSINEWRRRLECVVKNSGGLDISNTAISLELKLDWLTDNGVY